MKGDNQRGIGVLIMVSGMLLLFMFVQLVYAQEGIPSVETTQGKIVKEEDVQKEENVQEEVQSEGMVGLEIKAEPEGLVDLDLEDTDIRVALNALARVGGVNIVVGDDIELKVTLKLERVHWKKALDIILKTYNITSLEEDGLIRIMSFDRLKEEEAKIPLVTKVVYLNFVDVEDIKEPFWNG